MVPSFRHFVTAERDLAAAALTRGGTNVRSLPRGSTAADAAPERSFRCRAARDRGRSRTHPGRVMAGVARRVVYERIYRHGSVPEPLKGEHARAQIRELMREGVESSVVCTLRSYVNAAHELRLAELSYEVNPYVLVWVSHQV